MEVLKVILQYVLPPASTLIIGWLAGLVQRQKKRSVEDKQETDAYRESIKYMLRKSLKDDCDYYSSQGFCSMADKNDIEQVYELYHNKLHGNGPGTRYYQHIMALPDEKPTDNPSQAKL